MFRWFKKKLGYRWSAYFFKNQNELFFVMHHDAVFVIVGCLGQIFRRCGNPVSPWRVVLNFNPHHLTVPLSVTDFKPDGFPTDDLIAKIEGVDPDWVEGAGKGPADPPIFDPRTNREIDRVKVLEMIFEGY